MVWEFGDGTRSINPKPKHVYAAPGCYTVSLTFHTQIMQHSARKFIRINPKPTLNIGPKDTALCFQPRLAFLNASTSDNPDASYDWGYEPPDTSGLTTTDPPPAIPISSDYYIMTSLEGRYSIKKTWRCCEAYDSINVWHDSIIPQFRVNDNLQCLKDNNFIYRNTSVPSFKHTEWDFGNGKKATGDTGIMHYSGNTAYYPKMTTISKKGCKGSITRIMLVVKQPDARILADTTRQCLRGNIFRLRDSSTIDYGQGSLEKWNFDLGDSTKTTQKQFTKTYQKFGDYTVTLVVTSSQECRDTARLVLRVYEQPAAGFSIDNKDQCLSANKFIITDTAKALTNPITKRLWTFTDSTPVTDLQGQPLQFPHSYSSVDSFHITQRVSTGIGCFDSTSTWVHVHGDPYVNFTIDSARQCQQANKFTFTDTSSAEKGTIQTLQWDYGDNTQGSSKTKTYNQYGPYNIKLIATTNHGCKDSAIKPIMVDPMPAAGLTTSDSIQCYKNHQFTYSAAPSFIPVGSISTYHWDLGDSTTSPLKDPAPKTYNKDTTHTITLKVISDRGCADSTRKTVKFHPTPVAIAKVDKAVQCIEENVYYYTANGSTAPGGTITDYLWELGDGTIEQTISPPGKQYIKADTFSITLQTTTDQGCTDSASLKITVLPSPQANFEVAPTCLSQPSYFKDKSSTTPGKITSRTWKFGDGNQDTSQNPVHTYNNTGAYTVSLSVLSDFGCDATTIKINEAVVKQLPQAKFSHERIDYDEKSTTIQYTDQSIDVDQWLWDLGNNNTSSQQHPQIVYDDTATIPVTLIVKNNKGCLDTITQTLFIAPEYIFNIPNAFTPNRDIKNPTFGGEGTLYFKEYHLQIYNRWGQKVFESTNPLYKWDGTYSGEPCPDGMYTYIYLIRDVFGYYHNYKGLLTLLR